MSFILKKLGIVIPPTTTSTTTTLTPPSTTTTTTTTTLAPTTTTTTSTTTTTTLAPPSSPSSTFLNLNAGLARSINGGVTWTEDNDNYGGLSSSFKYGLITLSSSDIIVGAGSDGILYSSNGGINWNLSTSFPPLTNIRNASGNQGDTIIYALKSESSGTIDSIWKSTNKGINWTQTSSFGGVVGAGARTTTVLQSRNNRVIAYIFDPHKVIGSIDGGSTWTDISPPVALFSIFDSIQLLDNNTIVAAIGGDLWKTTNFGSSWSIISSSGIAGSRQINFVNPNVGIIGGAGGTAIEHKITINGGLTWSSSKFTPTEATSGFNRGMVIANDQEWWILRQPQPGGFTSYEIYYTSNAGASFTKQVFTSITGQGAIKLIF